MRRDCSLGLVVIAVLVAGNASRCVAGTIMFSNLVGPANQYGPDGVGIGHTPAFPPISPSFLTYATPFTSQSNFRLTMIEVPIGVVTGPNQVLAALASDAGGQPGALIETFLLTNLPTTTGPNGYPLVQVASVLNPILLGGQKYWFSATGGGITFAVWSLNLFQGRKSTNAFRPTGLLPLMV